MARRWKPSGISRRAGGPKRRWRPLGRGSGSGDPSAASRYAEDPRTDDKTFLPQLMAWLPRNSLLVFALGYSLSRSSTGWVQPEAGSSPACARRPASRSTGSSTVRSARSLHLGRYRSNPSTRPVRLIEVYVNGAWWRTNQFLDPQRLAVRSCGLVPAPLAYRRPSPWSKACSITSVAAATACSCSVGHLAVLRRLLDLCDEVAKPSATLDILVSRWSPQSLLLCPRSGAGYTGTAAQYFADNAKCWHRQGHRPSTAIRPDPGQPGPGARLDDRRNLTSIPGWISP